jgi:hypothetical protein
VAIKRDTLEQLLNGHGPGGKDCRFDELMKALAERVSNARADNQLIA